MSWSGFRKAFNRAGAQVMLKTGQLEASEDKEFEKYEEDFKTLETNSKKILGDLNEFDKLIDQMMDSQIKIVTTIDNFYGDDPSDGAISKELLKKLIHMKQDILPLLDEPLQITVLQPLQDFKELTGEFRNLIKKRQHKKLDYDLLSHKLSKLENEIKLQHNQNLEKEKTLNELNKVRPQYEEVSKIYLDLNSSLKAELQQFISLRSSIIDPSFESFIKVQNKYFNQFASELGSSEFKLNYDQINGEMDDLMAQLKELSNINLSSSSPEEKKSAV